VGVGHDAGIGAEDPVHVRADLADFRLEGGREGHRGVSLPPRPIVVTSFSRETPWYPATMTTFPRSSASRIRTGRTSTMRALLCAPSVMMPLRAGEADRVDAPGLERHPQERHRDPLSRSQEHVHSRRCGSSVTLRASASSSSVCRPWPRPTTHTPGDRLRAFAPPARPPARFFLHVGDGGAAVFLHDDSHARTLP